MKIVYLFNELKTELKKVQCKKLLVFAVLMGVILGTFGHCVSIGVHAADTETITLKAGTYRFNDVLTELEFEQDINIIVSSVEDDASLSLRISKIKCVKDEYFAMYWYVYSYLVDGEEVLDEPQYMPIYSSHPDFVFVNMPFTLTVDTEVYDTFGNWFISNTNYNEVNGGSGSSDALLGQTRYFSSSLDFSAVSGAVHDQFIYLSNGLRYSGMMIGSSLQTVSYMSTAGSDAAYSNANNPKWLNSNMRYITFVTLPEDPAVLRFILDNSVARGYGDTGEDTYDQGYDDGYNVGLVAGRIEGYNDGLAVGKEQGLNEGQEIGYNKGYQQGLLDGGNNPSKELVQSFIGDLFSLPQRLLDSIVFYQETLDDGGTPEDFSDDVILRITPWTAFVVVFIVSLIIILIKVWRGG